MLESEIVIINKKNKKMIITRSVSGIDKSREAVLLVMGKGYRYKTKAEIDEENKQI